MKKDIEWSRKNNNKKELEAASKLSKAMRETGITMKKDKEWLGGKVEKLKKKDLENWERAEPNGKDQMFFYGCLAAYENVLGFVDELDEPEITEEQAWYLIAKKYNQDGSYWFDARNHYLNTIGKVMVEKPVIPQFVADIIEFTKTKELIGSKDRIEHAFDMDKINNYILNNRQDYYLALAIGYTVKEEPKYTVCAEVIIDDEVYSRAYLFRNNYGRLETGHNKDLYNKGKERYQLTEKEIKTYAPDFWVLAERVEE